MTDAICLTCPDCAISRNDCEKRLRAEELDAVRSLFRDWTDSLNLHHHPYLVGRLRMAFAKTVNEAADLDALLHPADDEEKEG